jgi:vesicle coat complex subunit
LEIIVINRTRNTLRELMVELSTMGDMKIVERPQAHTIGPLDQKTIRASIKVSGTETGHIFGTIVYTDMALQEQKWNKNGFISMPPLVATSSSEACAPTFSTYCSCPTTLLIRCYDYVRHSV